MKQFSRKKKSNEQFIAEAKLVHDNKYDYSQCKYKNANSIVLINCPTHGQFSQLAYQHLCGHGCPKCKGDKRKSLLYGKGVYDTYSDCHSASYIAWAGILRRCYDKQFQNKHPTYKDVTICEEWHIYSIFKRWFDSENLSADISMKVDKDIIIPGNRKYSPETCCLVPNELNCIINIQKSPRDLPIGVYKCKNRYIAVLRSKVIGRFDSIKEASRCYIRHKRKLLCERASYYYKMGVISKRVRDAIKRYPLLSIIPGQPENKPKPQVREFTIFDYCE